MNIKDNFMFQQDKCPIHKSKETLEFFRQSCVALLDWPPYSPDLNIIENIWAMLSDDVYGKGSIKNLKELANRIEDSISDLNETRVISMIIIHFSVSNSICRRYHSNLMACRFYLVKCI